MHILTPAVIRRSTAIISSRNFFRCIVGFLIVQAAWIALSGRYPMAFDEDFHLGIIRLYAHHILPFWSGQPPGADMYGAVARDPSYLYQYLMSFPYRLISIFTHDQTIQVLGLRALNIGLFAASLAIYRRLLGTTGASRAAVNLCMLFFVLVPIVPELAAQINYDNLFLPLIGLVLLLAVRFDKTLSEEHRFDSKTALQLVTLCLLTSLVKYAFLPIFAALVVYLAVRTWRQRRQLPKPWFGIAADWQALDRWLRLGLVAAIVLAAGLFAERYAVNVIKYHNPIPDCSKVLSVQRCSAYGPWIRDYDFTINKIDEAHNPLVFSGDWFYGMWLRTFFAVGGPATDYQTRGPLPVPSLGAIVFSSAAVIAFVAVGKRLRKTHNVVALQLLLAVSLVYVATLWLDEYRSYARTGQPVAINGRYLLPVLLPLMLTGIVALDEALKRRQAFKLSLSVLAIVCLAWGGGSLTFILRSNDGWYWPNQAVRDMNHAVHAVAGPVTPGYHQPTEFLH
jgi:uncharacterized membrane protein